MTITYSACVCVCVDFCTQHAIRMSRIIACSHSGYTVFFHVISWWSRFWKKSYWIWNACFDFLYSFCLEHFSFEEEVSKIWSKLYIGLHLKYPLFFPDFNEIWIFSEYFRKILNSQISWKSVKWEPSCSMQTDGRPDIKKQIIVFRNFATAPQNCYL